LVRFRVFKGSWAWALPFASLPSHGADEGPLLFGASSPFIEDRKKETLSYKLTQWIILHSPDMHRPVLAVLYVPLALPQQKS
jgi:hypothetical protein